MFTLEGITGGKDAVLAATVNDPRWRAMRFKTTGTGLDVAKQVAQDIATRTLADTLRPVLEDAYEKFVHANGIRPGIEGPEADEWDSAADDVVSEALQPFERLLSADFLGRYTVDTRVHMPDQIDRIANEFGKEIWKQMVYDGDLKGPKSTAKVMSAVGVIGVDIDALIGAARQEERQKPMSYGKILNTITLFTMGAMSPDDLDLLLDQDAGISLGAQQRLGVTADDAETLREFARFDATIRQRWLDVVNNGELVPDDAGFDVLTKDRNGTTQPADIPPKLVVPPPLPAPAAPPPGALAAPPALPTGPAPEPVPPPPPVAPAPAPVAAPAAPPPAVTDSPPPPARTRGAKPGDPNTLPAYVLLAIREHAGIKDEEAAAILGVSRSTYNNCVKGKSVCVPTETQKGELFKLVHQRGQQIASILQALAPQS